MGFKDLKIIYKILFSEKRFSLFLISHSSHLQLFKDFPSLFFKTALWKFESLRAWFPIDAAVFQEFFEVIQLQPVVQCGGPSVFKDCGHPV